ncbi:MAG: folate-binding protein YgfZ [Proteobacteria bacterium]|nr:folate-binding protein YgfZ [Pseudomonadota bacterium]
MNSNFGIHLEHKSIISVSGTDCINFLQNIISNDIFLISDSNSIYSYLLSPQGKFLYDFMIIQQSKDNYLLQCNKKDATDFVDKLCTYKLRSNIEIKQLDEKFKSYFFNTANELIKTSFKTIKGFTISNDYGFFFNDPRIDEFGVHGIIYEDKDKDLVKELALTLLPFQTYEKLCHNTGLTDLIPAKALQDFFSLELNGKELHGVSFKKGCFVGQENTARMNLKNKIRKRVLPIQIISGSVEINEHISINQNIVGKIISIDPHCFAAIKIEEANVFEQIIPLKQGSIKITKPNWLKI